MSKQDWKQSQYYQEDGVTFAKDTNVPTNPVIPGCDDQYNIAEMAYNNGYAKGLEDGKKDSGKRERWIIRNRGNNSWAECPVCLTCGSPHWKVCPVCETRMEPMLLDDSFPGSKTINIKKPDVEVKSYGE